MANRILPSNHKILPRPEPATPTHLEMAKAIHDAVMERVGKSIDAVVQAKLKGFESSLGVLAGKLLQKELDGGLAELTKNYEGLLGEQGALVNSAVVSVKELEAGLNGRMDNLAKAYEDKATEMRDVYHKGLDDLRKNYEEQLTKMQEAHEQKQLEGFERHLGQFTEMLKSLPPMQVVVPDGALQVEVKQLPSVVQVSEKAFHLQLEQAVAPQINFTVPEKALQVNVETKSVLTMPKRKTTTNKSILYEDGTGRPDKVQETTVEETVEG